MTITLIIFGWFIVGYGIIYACIEIMNNKHDNKDKRN